MRVLVVDDDPTAQKIMRLFLERSGYKPEIHSNGNRVLELAQSADAPQIYILDWLMPGKDGLSLCKELRAARLKARPYVILFSSRNSAQEVVTALDAGADDFISKPFNVVETQARLRVARRLIEYQTELLQQLDDNEALMQRNNLLGEIIHRKSGKGHGGAERHKTQPVPHKPKLVEGNPANFSLQEIRFMLSSSLLELRLALQSLQQQTRGPISTDLHWCAWSPLMVVSHGLWLDLILDASEGEVLGLFKKSVGREPMNQAERSVYFSEIARTIAGGIARTLSVKAGNTMQPLMPRARMADVRALPTVIDSRSYDMIIDGQMLGLHIAMSPSSSLHIPPSQAQEFDVLAEPFPPHHLSEVPIFVEGVTLSPRFIEKMRHVAEASSENMLVSCYRPSAIARYFNGYQ